MSIVEQVTTVFDPQSGMILISSFGRTHIPVEETKPPLNISYDLHYNRMRSSLLKRQVVMLLKIVIRVQ